MKQEPVQIPAKGEPIRASWGASVANGINSCAAELAALRRPGRVESLRENPPDTPSALFPFLVRFVADPEGDGTQGTYICYIPEGSLYANNAACAPDAFGLEAYAPEDAPDAFPDWYVLPAPTADAGYWLWFEYDVAASSFAVAAIETAATEPEDGGSTVQRCVALAALDVTPADGDTPGSVKVRQTTRGPLSYEFDVKSLNSLVGHLAVAGDKDRPLVTENGSKYISVRTDDDRPGVILVGVSDEEPDEDGDKGYCNNVSREPGSADMGPENDISGDGPFSTMGGGDTPGNEISQWPCKKEAA